MKKTFCLLIVFVMMLAMIPAAQASEYMNVYALDGRVEAIKTSDFNAWHAVGWYSAPVMTVYAPDGRTEIIRISDFDAWHAVGWYSAPVMYVYAPDGRVELILQRDLQAWVNVGWSASNYVQMYSPYGGKETVALSNVQAWKNVGWYENTIEKNREAFIESAKKQLGIPDGIGYECRIGDTCYFWDAAQIWIVSVGFYSPYSGEYFAGASFDIHTGEKARNILDYVPGLYY